MPPTGMLPEAESIDRRSFFKHAAAASAAVGLGASASHETESAAAAELAGRARREPFVGIQIAPHSFYDEGIDYCLDLLRKTAGVNAPMISSLAYYGAMGRPRELMADHGVPIRDNAKRNLPRIWVRHHEKYYKDTTLRHMKPDPSWEYSGREIFSDLADAAHNRGMKIYERMYEPSSKAATSIRNFTTVLETDIFGRPGPRPCINNPDYQAWLVGTMQDLFESYDLDGIQYGAERSGPLGDWLAWNNPPRCFCEYCSAKARKESIDFDRAKAGLTEIHQYTTTLKEGTGKPSDGVFVAFLRLLMRYPEVLAWERLWCESLNELHRLIHTTVKSIRPAAEVGRHIDHQQSSYALLFRAAADYADMTDSNDFIKLILYHDIAGPRVLGKIDRLQKHVLRDLSAEQSLALYYAIFGYDPNVEASADELPQKGLSPEYVHRETKRAVDRVGGKAKIYAGIGLDIPRGGGWGTQRWPSDPDEVYKAVRRAFDAGGSGVVASREYEEIGTPSLKAVGRAVRDAAGAQ